MHPGFLMQLFKFQFIALFEMRTAPLAPRACEGGGRVKRGRGEYIRTPPVTAYGGASPLINAGAKESAPLGRSATKGRRIVPTLNNNLPSHS
jgi:hypothetical protein